MLKKLAGASLLVALCFTVAAAEEIKGNILKVGDGKVTIRLKAPKKGEKGEEKTFDLAKEVKVSFKEGKETKDVPDGLKSDLITGIDGKKGKGGAVITNTDNKVTEIVINAPKKDK